MNVYVELDDTEDLTIELRTFGCDAVSLGEWFSTIRVIVVT